MDADSKLQDRALSLLNEAIKAMNLAKELSTITPATAVFCSVIILLTIIRVRFLLLSNNLFQLHTRPGLHGQ